MSSSEGAQQCAAVLVLPLMQILVPLNPIVVPFIEISSSHRDEWYDPDHAGTTPTMQVRRRTEASPLNIRSTGMIEMKSTKNHDVK
jgi:hypothetical protein